MKAHIFEHAPFEGPAAILDWLTKNQFNVSYTRFYDDQNLPSTQEVDWLIIMGGSMSVNDEKELPWLVEEKKFIKQCIDSGKTVVGICLGSQLIANTLGSKVYPARYKEIGWFPLLKVNGLSSGYSLPEQITVFHWHGETFDLPPGARLIASTEACTNQIYIIGTNIIGMQCHLEMTPQAIDGMLKDCSDEIQPASYIQNIDDIKRDTEKFTSEANQVLFSLLDSLKYSH